MRHFGLNYLSMALAVALFSLCAGPSALARTVEFEGVELTLGEPAAEAMAELKTRFTVLKAITPGYYNLYRKRLGSLGNAVNSVAIGGVTMHNGKFVALSRNFGSFQSQDGQGAISNFIAAVAQAQAELTSKEKTGRLGPSESVQPYPRIYTDTIRTGNAQTTRIYVTFPDHAVQMAVYHPDDLNDVPTVEVTEQYLWADESQEKSQ